MTVAYLMLGCVGDDVGRLQQQLVEIGARIDQAELAAEKYGPSTVEAVKRLQLERGLTVDGISGPRTLRALALPRSSMSTAPGWRCRPSDVDAAVRPVIVAAVNDLGTREEPPGSNAGPGLLKYRGHTPGQPWCAYWVSWAWSHHALGCPWGVLGSAYKIKEWALDRGGVILTPADEPRPGDVGVRMRTRFKGHVWLVVDNTGGQLSTVGGNEPSMVAGRVRTREDATVFVRPR